MNTFTVYITHVYCLFVKVMWAEEKKKSRRVAKNINSFATCNLCSWLLHVNLCRYCSSQISFTIVFVCRCFCYCSAVATIIVVRLYLSLFVLYNVTNARTHKHSHVAKKYAKLYSQFNVFSRRSNTYDFVNLLTYRHDNVVDKWILVLFNRQWSFSIDLPASERRHRRKILSHCLLM